MHIFRRFGFTKGKALLCIPVVSPLHRSELLVCCQCGQALVVWFGRIYIILWCSQRSLSGTVQASHRKPVWAWLTCILRTIMSPRYQTLAGKYHHYASGDPTRAAFPMVKVGSNNAPQRRCVRTCSTGVCGLMQQRSFGVRQFDVNCHERLVAWCYAESSLTNCHPETGVEHL